MTVARSKSKTSEETSPSIIQEKLTGGEGDPCRQSVAQVLVALGVDGQLGLSTAEAAKRLKRYGRNELTAEKPVPAWRKFLAQFTDVLVILLLIAGLISAGLWLYERDSAFPYEATAIFAIVLLNGVMGYVQQARAEQALAALRKLSAAHAAVIRDGARQRIPAVELVPGDIILVEEGDAVPADARLIQSTALQTAEAAFTGESLPVSKDIAPLAGEAGLGDRRNMIFARRRGRIFTARTIARSSPAMTSGAPRARCAPSRGLFALEDPTPGLPRPCPIPSTSEPVMSKTVSDFFVDRLHEWGVRRIFGYPGDGINGVLGSLQRDKDTHKIEFIQVRHEEMAAFMACAYAKFSGEIGVCLSTGGPGATHMITGLYDAKLDHVPVLAITGQAAADRPRRPLSARAQSRPHVRRLCRFRAGSRSALAGPGSWSIARSGSPRPRMAYRC